MITLYLILATVAHATHYGHVGCKVDADCVKVEEICGRKSSVNKVFKDEHLKSIEKMGPAISCEPPTKPELEYLANAVAVCKAEKCTLEAPKKK